LLAIILRPISTPTQSEDAKGQDEWGSTGQFGKTICFQADCGLDFAKRAICGLKKEFDTFSVGGGCILMTDQNT
jgi:hypothetical protein